MANIKIAIDGPAGAGKSTLAKAISKQLGYKYIDTGAMYRAVALKAIRNGIDTQDTDMVISVLDGLDITIKYSDGGQIILLDGEDVTDKIRTPELSIGASNVALIPSVRKRLVEIQRELAEENNVVMDGRDIGTHVLPNADIKIFLTASIEDRATRRYEEMLMKGSKCNYETIKNDMNFRDSNDSGRDFAPLKVAENAILIDTSGNSYEQSFSMLLDLITDRIFELKKN